MATGGRLAARLSTGGAELGAAIAACIAALLVAAALLGGGTLRLHPDNAGAFFVTVFLGPILATVGAWLDVSQRQPFGIMVLALGVLLALDGVFATFFIGSPTLLLLILSFASALLRRRLTRPDQA